MTRTKALILGVCTLWPIMYMFLFMGTIFSQVILMNLGSKPASGQMPTVMKIIFPLHLLTML